jgi:hypothetical protein
LLLSPQKPERETPRPLSAFGNIPVPGTRAGAIVSIGLAVIAWIGLPEARPFILGTIGLGIAVGLLLQWKHNKL